MVEMKVCKDENGNVRYFRTYQMAWKLANALNEPLKTGEGLWFFEMDMNGWYLFFDKNA